MSEDMPDLVRRRPKPSEFWQNIRQRPALYLGDNSLSALYHFLAGWEWATDFHRVEEDSLHAPPCFGEWVAYRERFYESTSGWCRMLLARYPSEEAALQRFFELCDEHQQRVPRVFAHVENVTKEMMLVRSDRLEPVVATSRLSLVTYTDDPGFFARFDAPAWSHREKFHPFLGDWMMFGDARGRTLEISDQAEYDRVVKPGDACWPGPDED